MLGDQVKEFNDLLMALERSFRLEPVLQTVDDDVVFAVRDRGAAPQRTNRAVSGAH
jgi:hypothetical protein